MSQTINIPTEGGEFSAYVARPTNAAARGASLKATEQPMDSIRWRL
jgi:hypothetical protein